jgi:hypothetical protein
MIDPRTHRRSDRLLTVLLVWILVGSDAHRAAVAGASADVERWVYCSTNLQVDRSADDVIMLIERAGRDGYTAVMLADYKFLSQGSSASCTPLGRPSTGCWNGMPRR